MNAEPVALRSITADTVRSVCALAVAPDQQAFVAPNAVSLAQALFAPDAWFRAIYRGNDMVGFVMLRDSTQLAPPADSPTIGLWRFMIDARFQGRGIGRAALRTVIEQIRARGVFSSFTTSYVPGARGPEHFYLGLGFTPTGDVRRGEIVLALPLV